MGAAILDYQTKGKAGKLSILSSMFEEDEMPVKHLFRNLEEMPMLEQKALSLAKGKVLDVGAGAGCHALALQAQSIAVKAIDISPQSCQAMLQRGVKDVECINLFDPHLGSKSGMGSEDRLQNEGRLQNEDRLQNEGGSQNESGFDTILLLMNGTGIAGKIENLPALFNRLKALLNKGGQILIDSSDIKYIYENEDGSFDINLNAAYYGEVDYQMVYKDVKGDSFDWLYVDFPLLKSIAESCGLHSELIAEGEHYDYLGRFF